MAFCVTHNISFDPQWEWCTYCGKPKTAELVVVENTSTNNARDEIAALANELEDFNTNRIVPYGRITEIVARMRQLSPVA